MVGTDTESQSAPLALRLFTGGLRSIITPRDSRFFVIIVIAQKEIPDAFIRCLNMFKQADDLSIIARQYGDERDLFAAVIMQSIFDLAPSYWKRQDGCGDGCRKPRCVCATAWFLETRDTHAGSFKYCCHVLDLDADAVLRALRRRGLIQKEGDA